MLLLRVTFRVSLIPNSCFYVNQQTMNNADRPEKRSNRNGNASDTQIRTH
jgi:hypothetical protein